MRFALLAATPVLALAAFGAQGLPVEGNSESPVKVLVYEDLQCSDCAVFREMLDRDLLPKYGKQVAFVHRDFPLAKHAWARTAAIAGRYFASVSPKLATEYRRYVMRAQKEITPENFKERLATFAKSHRADPAAAVASLDNAEFAAAVERDYQDAVARGIAKTPTVLVNGTPFIETFTVAEISKGIDQALAETH